MKTLFHLARWLTRRGRASFITLFFAGIAFANPTNVFAQQLSPSVTAEITVNNHTVSLESQDGIMGTVPFPVAATKEVILRFSPLKAGQPLEFCLCDGGEID